MPVQVDPLVRRAWSWHTWSPRWLPSRAAGWVKRIALSRCDRPVLCALDTGHAFLAYPDDLVQCTICVNGEWEGLIYEAIRSLVPTGGTVLDVGAHVGYSSVRFADWVGPSGRVHSFEPLPQHAEQVLENLRLNGLAERVEVHRLGVADREGEAAFHYATSVNTGVGSLRPQHGTSRRLSVRTVALDRWCDERGIDEVHLVKIDVEGAEALVLGGMAAGLASRRYRALLVEVHDALLPGYGSSSASLHEQLRAAGCSLFSWQPDARFVPCPPAAPTGYLLATSPSAAREVVARFG